QRYSTPLRGSMISAIARSKFMLATQIHGAVGSQALLPSWTQYPPLGMCPREWIKPNATGCDCVAHRLAPARQPEEPVVLADRLRRRAVLVADRDVILHERLASGVVVASPLLEIQVAARGARAPQPLDGGSVPRISRCFDEVVGCDIEQGPERAERGCVAI